MSTVPPTPSPLRSRLAAAWNRGWIPPPDAAADPRPELKTLNVAQLAELFGANLLPGRALDDLLAAEDLWQPGDTLGREYVIEQIHEGGCGRVFLCRCPSNGLTVALKTLRRHLLDAAGAAGFEAEARRWIELGAHPHVVHAHGLERISGRIFLVLERMPDGTLADALLAGRPGWEPALRTGAQVAAALAHAERRLGLVHGDIKPANILLAPDGTAKLTDFGISFARLTETGDAMPGSHTPGYVGPEFSGTTARSTATDMYAFGVTLWQCVTARAAQADPTFALPPDVPAVLAAVIRQCLQPRAADRPGSFLTLAGRLAELHGELLRCPPATGYLAPGAGQQREAAEAARQAANLSLSLRELGRTAPAEAAARRATELDPGYAAGHDALASVLLDLGHPGEAAAAAARAAALTPDDISVRLHFARALRESGLPDLARKSLHHALRLAEAQNRLGALGLDSALLVQLEPVADALAWLERITTADPGQLGAWINQVALLRSLDRTETALACARHAVNLHPGDALAWGALSGALLDQHKPAEAMEAVERGLALAAEHPGLLAQQRAVQQTLDR
jgi:serine/threonine protein kinase